MTIEASPPAQPPQVSPDGKWIWDGAQWRPFAVHEAIFPTWKSVGVGLPPDVGPAAQAPAVAAPSRHAPAAAPAYRMAAPPPSIGVPLWKRDRARPAINRNVYLAAGAVALLIVGISIGRLLTMPPPRQAVSAPATPAATAPVDERSDSGRAARLVNGVLATPIAELADELTLVRQTCAAGMTSACEDSLLAAERTTAPLLPAIDASPVPTCIQGAEARLRSDIGTLDAGARLGLKGFADGRKAEVTNGVAQVRTAGARVPSDYAALTNAAKGCATDVLGP